MRVNRIPDEIREFMEYNPLNGNIHWIKSPNRAIKIGKLVGGSINSKGYKTLKFNKITYLYHRVAYFLHTGTQPEFIDHDDRDRTNNVFSNLNNTSLSGNQKNVSKRVDNTSGFTGVNFDKKSNKWYAHGFKNNQRITIGGYIDKEDAIHARKLWNIENGYHINHGN